MLPWVAEVFLAWGGTFRCWPNEGPHIFGHRLKPPAAGHYKDLTEPETALEKSLAPRVTKCVFPSGISIKLLQFEAKPNNYVLIS